MANEKTLTPEQTKVLIQSAPTTFNLSSFTPTASVFKLTKDVLRSELLKQAKSYISDFSNLTLEINNKTGAIFAFVWLPNDSPHIRDNSTITEGTVIKKPIYRYSKEMKEFMDKFCESNDKRTFSDENNSPLVGIKIRIDVMLRIIFDESGYECQKRYGTQNKIRSRISLTAHFKKGTDSNFGDLKYIEVVKKLSSDVVQMDPRPKKSFKY